MPARPGLSQERVVSVALGIVDEAGLDALTLALVAQRTGVATPSLYKHVDGLAALRRLLRLRVLAEFDEALRAATIGRAGEQALRALGVAYREHLRDRPHRHPFIEAAPDADDEELQAATYRVLEVVFAALRGYGLTGEAAIHATRCLRSAIHGFTRLEAVGGFGMPENVDTTFEQLLDMVAGTVAAMARSTEGP